MTKRSTNSTNASIDGRRRSILAKLPLAYLQVIRASSMSQTIVEGCHSMVEIVCFQVTVEELSYEMMLKRSDTIFREVHPCSDVHGFGTPTHSFFQNKRHDAWVQSMHSHVTRFRVGVLAFACAWSSFVSYVDIAKDLLEFVQSTKQSMFEVTRSRGEHAQRVKCDMTSTYVCIDRSIPRWTQTIGIDADVDQSRPRHLGIVPRSVPWHCISHHPRMNHSHPTISPLPSSILHASAMVGRESALVQATTCYRGVRFVPSFPGGPVRFLGPSDTEARLCDVGSASRRRVRVRTDGSDGGGGVCGLFHGSRAHHSRAGARPSQAASQSVHFARKLLEEHSEARHAGTCKHEDGSGAGSGLVDAKRWLTMRGRAGGAVPNRQR